METEERIRCLQHIDLFDFMSAEEQRNLAEDLPEVRLQAGDILFQEGDQGDEMFVLLNGALKIHKNIKIITVLEAVDYIGEMALIDDKPRSATVVAITSCELLKIDREVFKQQIADQPGCLASIMKSLTRKIRKDIELIAEEFNNANILIHDMRNLLTSFMFLDLFQNELPYDPHKRYMQIMINNRRNLATLMDEAMDNAKRIKQPYVLQKGSLVNLLTELINHELNHHPILADKNIQLTVKNDLPDFPFQRLDIRRVVANLLINAGQASRPGDDIGIVIDRQDDNAIIRFQDHGCGIPLEMADKIFNPLFSTREGGNGLGLPSCKQIIEEKHGGRLNFTSTPDAGTVFTCSLPLNNHSYPA